MNAKLPADHVLTRGTVVIDVEACKGAICASTPASPAS